VPQDQTLTLAQWIAANQGAVWYWGAFTFGLGVLLVFSLRRFNELLFALSPDLAALLPHYTAASLTRRKQFRLGFAAYFLVYAFVYVGLCLCQPLAAWAFKAGSGAGLADSWTSPAGPLLVVSFLVGVLPNLPLVEEVEHALRRIGHRIAGIPDNLLQLIDEVARSGSIGEQSVIADENLRADLAETAVLTELIGVPEPARKAIQANLTHAYLLGTWIHTEQARAVWSERVLTRFAASTQVVTPEADQCERDLHILIRDWRRLLRPKLDAELQQLNLTFADIVRDRRLLADGKLKAVIANFIASNEAVAEDMQARWKSFASQCAKLSYHDEALFALFVLNETTPGSKSAPAHIRDAIASLRPERISALLNPVLFASAAGALACVIALVVLRLTKTWVRNDAVDAGTLLRTALRLGWGDSVNMLLLCAVPVVAATVLRYSKKSDGKWTPLYGNPEGVPFLQIAGVALATFLAASVLQMAYYLVVQLVSSAGGPLETAGLDEIFGYFFSSAARSQILASLIGATLAISVCYLFDRRERGSVSLEFGAKFSLFVVVCLILLFSGIQIPLAAEGYFTAQSLGGFEIKPFDNLTKDYLAIATFILVFLGVLFHQLRHLSATAREPQAGAAAGPDVPHAGQGAVA
jgi:hypothetical protein